MKITVFSKIMFSFHSNQRSWDKYMENGISRHKFQDMSQLVQLEGTQTAQRAHCTIVIIISNDLALNYYHPHNSIHRTVITGHCSFRPRYKTHAIGKWHLGFCDEKYLPTRYSNIYQKDYKYPPKRWNISTKKITNIYRQGEIYPFAQIIWQI